MAKARLLSLDALDDAAGGWLSSGLGLDGPARAALAARAQRAAVALSEVSADERAWLRALAAPDVLVVLGGDGSRGLIEGSVASLRAALARGPLAAAVLAALEPGRDRRLRWEVGGALLPARTAVMGVVNVTPDSFSDGGRFADAGAAVAHGILLEAEGADLLDVGGESTRPGGGVYGGGMDEVPAAEEIARVVPVIEGLVRSCRVPVSIDTRKLEVARAALDAGAKVINDVSALGHAPGLAALAAERGAGLCLMHMKGEFRSMQAHPVYEDLLAEVAAVLARAAQQALDAGVPAARICLDPGIGFGKTVEHNLKLIRAAPSLQSLGYPVLIGASRKSFVGKLTQVAEPGQRLHGSVAAAVAAAMSGASVVRVHDVRATVEALRVADAVLGA
jgi:dihydropteroate synthase